MTELPPEPMPGQQELPLDFGEVSDIYEEESFEEWPENEGFDWFIDDPELLREILGKEGNDCA